MMKVCKKCILPGTYPGISFNSEGICNLCQQHEKEGNRVSNRYFNTPGELSACLEKYRAPESRYDILVPLSGGVDSSYALIHMVETFKLRPLVYHNDHGYEDPVATANARRLCQYLDVDLVIWQNEAGFMKKLWKYFNESTYIGLSACYVCANILYLNALELADRFDIKLIVNGYTKGQMAMQHNKVYARELYAAMMDVVSKSGDRDFYHRFTAKWKMLDKQITFHSREDLEKSVDPGRILVLPFFAFKFYQTDKQALRKACIERFSWQPLETTYPARTTNCIISYLNTFMDLKRMNYSVYTEEYATLVRNGEMSREQALEDLRFNPSPGLVERLAAEVGVELESPRTEIEDQDPEALKKRKVIEKYWSKTLSGPLPKITLPFINEGASPGVGKRKNPQTLRLAIPRPIYASLQEMGNHSQLAVFILFLAGYIILLNRYTRIRDLVIGTITPAAGTGTTNIVFCRNRVAAGFNLKELIGQVKESVLDAFNYGDYPVETLVRKLPAVEGSDIPGIFSAACIHDGLQVRDKNNAPNLNRFHLVTVLSVKENQPALVVEYNGDLYPEKGIKSFARNLVWFYRNIRGKLDREVTTIDIVCPEEKETLLFSFNRTPWEYPDYKTVIQWFREQAAKTPGNTSLVSSGEANICITYGELNRQANRLAVLLKEKGVKPGTIVGILKEPSVEMIVAIIGVLKAGGAYLPIDDQLPENRTLTILNDANASILLTGSREIKNRSFTALQGLWLKPMKPYRTPPQPQVKDFDAVPFPDRSLVNYQEYNRYLDDAMVKHSMSIQATRGCPYGCLYCHKIWPRTQVVRSAQNIFAEVKLYYDLGVRRFAFVDDIFNLDRQNSLEFFQRVITAGFDIQIFFPNGMRGDLLTPGYIDLMVKAGVTGLALALETASPRLQKLIKKYLDIGKLQENLQYLCQQHPGVILELFTMHGFPTETKEEALMTLDFVKNLKWVHFPYINLLKVWQGTGMEKLALENGISHKTILCSEDMAQHEVADTLSFDRKFTMEYQADFIKNYFLSRERLLHVLPFQMQALTEDDLVRKYDSYLPVTIDDFDGLLRFVGIHREELNSNDFRDEARVRVPDLDEKLRNYFPAQKPAADACRILLLDISQSFSRESHQLNDLVEPPLGLMYLLTYLNHKLGGRIHGKIAKPLIDFDSFGELKQLIKEFQPDMIGIRSLIFYKNFFHRTVAMIRHWGFETPIIAGGPYATSSYETLLQDRHIDLAVLGEGELPFTQLVEQFIENRKKLPNEEVLNRIAGLAFIPASEKALRSSSREIILLDELAGALSVVPGSSPEPINQPEDPAYVIFTSGSTGTPKGILVEHRNLSAYLKAFLREFTLTSEDTVLQQASFSFDAFVEELYPVLLRGGKLALAQKEQVRDPHLLEAFITTHQVTIITCSPLLLDELNKMNNLKGVRTYISGGDVLKQEHVDKLMETAVVYNTYGPTETTVCAAYYKCAKNKKSRFPIGHPITNYNLYILDQRNRLVPTGAAGELYIAGAGVTRGYLNNPELTDEKFNHDLWDYQDDQDKRKKVPGKRIDSHMSYRFYRSYIPKKIYKTGDRARWLTDGNIEFLGRSDHQVQVRGYRVEPAEIERHLLNHRAVTAAAVVLRQDKTGDSYLCAYVVSRERIPGSEFRGYLAAELPAYMIPAHFMQLEQIPLTPGGKLDRQALPEPVPGGGGIAYITEEKLRKQSQLSPGTNLQRPEQITNNNGFHCFIMGDTTLPIQCGEILLRHGHTILGMVSDDPRVKDWAVKNRIPVVTSRKSTILPFLKAEPFDYLMGIFNTHVLPEEILRLPRKFTLNYHDGPLPAYAGMHVPSWAIINRETTHAITWHIVDKGIDTGDILKKKTFPIDSHETAFSLHMKCYDAAAETFTQLIHDLAEGKITRQQQNRALRSYFPKFKRPPGTGLISFNREAKEIHALVRALTFGDYENPLGLPKIRIKDDFLLVTDIALTSSCSSQVPGSIVSNSDSAIVVSTPVEEVEIREVLSIEGLPIPIPRLVQKHRLTAGTGIHGPDNDTILRIDAINSRICRYEHAWVKRLANLQPLRLVLDGPHQGNCLQGEESRHMDRETFSLPPALKNTTADVQPADLIIAVFAAFLLGLSRGHSFDIGYTDASLQDEVKALTGLFADVVPMHIKFTREESFLEFNRAVQKELKKTRKYRTYTRDIFARYPQLKTKAERRLNIGVARVPFVDDKDFPGLNSFLLPHQLTLVVPEKGDQSLLVYDNGWIDKREISRFLSRFTAFAAAAAQKPQQPVSTLPAANDGLKGRIDRRILLDGRILDPLPMENRLTAYHPVKRAAVIAKHQPGGHKYLCACLESDEPLQEGQLRTHLEEIISQLSLPIHFVQLEKMPLTLDNTVDIRFLESMNIEINGGIEFTVPTDETEEKLSKIWSDVLGIEQYAVGTNADFFDLGGHSLKATILIARVDREFGVRLRLTEVFRNSTIKGLARMIRASTGKSIHNPIKPAPKKAFYPLSSAQKRLYIQQQIEPDSTRYNMSMVVMLEGNLRTDKLESVFLQLIRRHESLRTSFELTGEQPVQKIHNPDNVEFTIEYYDFDGSEGIENTGGTRGIAPLPGEPVTNTINNFIRPFDLSHVPLLRVGLIPIPHQAPTPAPGYPMPNAPFTHQKESSAGRMILMVDLHHIISDGISHTLLVKEFISLYGGAVLPENRIHYKDFSEWRNRLADSKEIKNQEHYWLKQFHGEIPVLTLPLDFPRPARQSFAGDAIWFEIDTSRTEKLKNMASAEGATIFMVLLAIYTVLLFKISGQEDIVVGTPIAGRGHTDLERVMGMFVNMLPLRNFPSRNKPFIDFVKEIKQGTLEAFENQDYQFENLVERITAKRNPGHHPLFDAIFVFQNLEVLAPEIPETHIPHLKILPFSYKNRVSRYDLGIAGNETNGRIILMCEYSTQLFKPSTVERFTLFFREIVSAVIKNKHIKLMDIPLSQELLTARSNPAREGEGDFGF